MHQIIIHKRLKNRAWSKKNGKNVLRVSVKATKIQSKFGKLRCRFMKPKSAKTYASIFVFLKGIIFF